MKDRLYLLGGVALGAAMMLTVAACVPPTPDTPPETEIPMDDSAAPADGARQDYDTDILDCGVNAKPAVDQDVYGNWWAYCEPALVP